MRSIVLFLIMALVVTGCSRFPTYDGPQVTRIVVMKSDRIMYLMHNDTVLESYEFELGFAPVGDKAVEGDGRTPEGRYFIDRRNPDSAYYLSLGISYPNDTDRAEAAEAWPVAGWRYLHPRHAAPVSRSR